MKILVISGLLGAGKTTFIQYLAKKTQEKFVILENDVAGANIDKHRLEANPDLNIWELTEGCICCQSNTDFRTSVIAIANALDPEYLVIEPTGVGYLGNIIHELNAITYERIQLLAPITIVDGMQYNYAPANYPDLFDNQVQAASRIIVSKTETLSVEEREDIRRRLTLLNPLADIYADGYLDWPKKWYQDLLQVFIDGSRVPKVDEKFEVETVTYQNVHLTSVQSLVIMLDNLVRGHFGQIVRSKGAVQCSSQLIRFDVVNQSYVITEADTTEENTIVFIGQDIDGETLANFLEIHAQEKHSQFHHHNHEHSEEFRECDSHK